jgi:SAM-dependent methyltransferase
LHYVKGATGSVFCPKFVGSYEAPLTPFIEQAIGRNHAIVIDIGCAEGYYAVGLASRMLQTEVIAYDIDPVARQLCYDLACLNNVSDRVKVREICNAQELNRLNLREGFILCDVEGAEVDILQPEFIPSLKSCTLIVELHDHLRPSVSQKLLPKFHSTHHIQLVRDSPRRVDDYAFLTFLPKEDRRLAVNEFRPSAEWAIMSPRTVKG